MNIAGLIIGILALLGMLLGLIPCFGALNWLNLPFATLGLILSILGYNQSKNLNQSSSAAVTGMILCIIAIMFGSLRLVLGGGII